MSEKKEHTPRISRLYRQGVKLPSSSEVRLPGVIEVVEHSETNSIIDNAEARKFNRAEVEKKRKIVPEILATPEAKEAFPTLPAWMAQAQLEGQKRMKAKNTANKPSPEVEK